MFCLLCCNLRFRGLVRGNEADAWVRNDRHAGRQTISADDVLLLARRNDGLESLLKEFVEKRRASAGKGGGRGR